MSKLTINFFEQTDMARIISVKFDLSYKREKIFASKLTPENQIRTSFAIMVSSLHKI